MTISLDLLGDFALNAKNFWYDTRDKTHGNEAFQRSLVDLFYYKLLALAKRLGYSKLYIGQFDPQNPRLQYKFERFLHVTEVLCDAGWKCLSDVVVQGEDGSFAWSGRFANPRGFRPGYRASKQVVVDVKTPCSERVPLEVCHNLAASAA